MAILKICLILSAAVISSSQGHFRYEHFRAFSFNSGEDPPSAASSFPAPFFLDSGTLKASASDVIPRYQKESLLSSPSSNPHSIAPPYVKRIPKEDKSSKKLLPGLKSFYTLTEKDDPKYRELVLKFGVPVCQKIPALTKQGLPGDGLTCYSCKDSKDSPSYKYCTYDPAAEQQVVAKSPSSQRYRRSSYDENEKPKDLYRFGDEYFVPDASTVAANSKDSSKDSESCEKILKDSMVCMVCQDPKTNGKYEQCSYVAKPKEKAYAYTKSSSFGKPKGKSSNTAENPSQDEETPSETKSDCKKIQKDSQTCTVCKDPATGGNFERCSYAYQPPEKSYEFSRSKSFGYPEKDNSPRKEDVKEDSEEREAEGSEEREVEGSEKNPRSSTYDHSAYQKSEDESKPLEASSSQKENCKTVEKDSMTCTVCKDPSTGGNSEQCNYSFNPKDKVFSYSKAKSFGTPTEREKSPTYASASSYKPPDDAVSYYEDQGSYQASSYKSEASSYPEESSAYTFPSDTKLSSIYSIPEYVYEPSKTGTHGNYEASETNVDEAKVDGTKGSQEAPKSDKVDLEFFNTVRKKAELEKFLKEFQNEDRTNCKKVMRDKMTCYQCTDAKGFEKEECMFITSPGGSKENSAYREAQGNQDQAEPEGSEKVVSKKPIRREVLPPKESFLEPSASATEVRESVDGSGYRNHDEGEEEGAKYEAADGGQKGDENEKNEQSEGGEAYAFADETRPVFDKVLGVKLPAYMVKKSEHEEEFDAVVAASKI